MTLFLLLSTAARAACSDGGLTSSDVGRLVGEGWSAFAELDEDVFTERVDEAKGALPCLLDVLPAATAADLHRAVGVRAFLDGDEQGAGRAFQAALSLQPAVALPPSIAPVGGPLAAAFAAAAEGEPPTTQAVTPAAGETLYFDGTATNTRPRSLPTVLQVRGADETVRFGSYLPAFASLPTAATTAPKQKGEKRAAAPSDDLDDEAPLARAGNPWKGAAIGSAVATAALYGAAAAFRTAYDERPTEGRYRGTNLSYFGALGAGGLTVGFGAAALVRANGD
jgi:hypothetical protein